MKIVTDVAGKVWKIEVTVGAVVAADDVILILESMKMEIPVQAPRAGRLAELFVEVGEMLDEGALVARME
jgi:acetyl-CoA carboxylase biotin carboxyl carrier protein